MAESLESCTFELSLDLADDGDMLDVSWMNCLRTVQVDSILFKCLSPLLYQHHIVNKDSDILEMTFSFIARL